VKNQEDFNHLQLIKGVYQPSQLNEAILGKLKKKKKDILTSDNYLDGIKNGDRNILAQAITLIESNLTRHKDISAQIVDKCLPLSGNSVRIGITGVPGVGKSTFIEAIGSLLTEMGNKVAVLAIDPSSNRSRGSILGDKTRMQKLAVDKNAFIRPSPSAGTSGGVARKTRETIILCEAAGFNIIFVETVGVGQSEIAVHSMVDVFLLLMLAGAGDELQGIKRGIMEMADMLVLNKSDDVTKSQLNRAVSNYTNALHLIPSAIQGWTTPVEYCSSISGFNMDKIWTLISGFVNYSKNKHHFYKNRQEQAKYWFYESLNHELNSLFYNNPLIKKQLARYEQLLTENSINPFDAANLLLNFYLKINQQTEK